ncbi:MAG: hypothetical protein GXY80_15320 [Syntrophorhabdus aromaticivorans]|uniref:Uncharacterized protein n=1 Tax=Syntrophorhabdus aromaticivorans TaxID=328301 RepID=A0A971S2D0_9BACT|nr:hypothetical protein [Syntrophorhabdus aromaticivorans]
MAANFAAAASQLITDCSASGKPCNDIKYTICSDSTGNLRTAIEAAYNSATGFATYGYFFAADTTAAKYDTWTGTGDSYVYATGVPVFFGSYNTSGIHQVGDLINSLGSSKSMAITGSVQGNYTINTASAQYIGLANSTAPYGQMSHTLINQMQGTSLPDTIPSYVYSPLWGNIGICYDKVMDHTTKTGFVGKSQICNGSGGVDTNTYVYVEFTASQYLLTQKAIKLNTSDGATALDDYITSMRNISSCSTGSGSWCEFIRKYCYQF